MEGAITTDLRPRTYRTRAGTACCGFVATIRCGGTLMGLLCEGRLVPGALFSDPGESVESGS